MFPSLPPGALSHASWSSVKASRILLRSLVEVFVPEGDPLVVGIDETLERRYGKKIAYTRASTETRFVLLMKTS